MSYREKCAWLMLVAILITFGPYFIIVAVSFDPDEPMPNFRQLWLYGIAAGTQMIIAAVGHIVLRIRNLEEARTPMDERELVIRRRAVSAAYYVMMSGMILVGIFMPFIASGWEIVNPAIATVGIAELVNYGLTVISYRRQS